MNLGGERSMVGQYECIRETLRDISRWRRGVRVGVGNCRNGVGNFRDGVENFRDGVENCRNGVGNFRDGVENFRDCVGNRVVAWTWIPRTYQASWSYRAEPSSSPSWQQRSTFRTASNTRATPERWRRSLGAHRPVWRTPLLGKARTHSPPRAVREERDRIELRTSSNPPINVRQHQCRPIIIQSQHLWWNKDSKWLHNSYFRELF